MRGACVYYPVTNRHLLKIYQSKIYLLRYTLGISKYGNVQSMPKCLVSFSFKHFDFFCFVSAKFTDFALVILCFKQHSLVSVVSKNFDWLLILEILYCLKFLLRCVNVFEESKRLVTAKEKYLYGRNTCAISDDELFLWYG